MAEVSLKNISKRFKSVTAVSNLSLDIADGEFVVLLGPTGAGKTTTLRLVAGLEKPDEGEKCACSVHALTPVSIRRLIHSKRLIAEPKPWPGQRSTETSAHVRE